MDEPPIDHAICACCGTQFGYDDTTKTYQRLRNEWLSRGGYWFDPDDEAYPKSGWNAWDQLDLAGFKYLVQRPKGSLIQTDRFDIPMNVPIFTEPMKVAVSNA